MKTSRIQMGKAHEAKRKMLELLQSGQYESGERLPPESELAKVLGCCRGTVREVIGLLVNEGCLSHTRGVGTYVSGRGQEYRTIAAIFPDICKEPNDNNTRPPIVSSIVAEARSHNADVILYGCGDEDPDLERNNIKRAIDRHVDAVVLWYIGGDRNLDVLEELYASGIPVVFVDRYVEKFNPDYAVTDNFGGIFDAVNEVAHMGIDSIYFITNIEECTSIRDRTLGYTAAVNALGLPCNVVYSHVQSIVQGVYSGVKFEKNSNEYLSLKKTIEYFRFPAALFSPNPTVNTVIYEVIEDLNIPKDQIILGHFDCDPHRMSMDRCFFEVDQPFAEIGSTAVRFAMNRIAGKTEPQQIALKPTLEIHNLSAFTGIMPNADALSSTKK